ncbi:MAG: molybdopterin-guanine dinucleotide biosynthesis protein B [Candidatus Eisenbacteria sp.]|nr:molybdopterin-guanine dinucleotide biosynthesis protein B [Candidatus Eisenbacteria bacterium]
MKRLQVVGRKKSGKTGLVVRLIPLLQGRGLRVGSIKHSSHPHPLDREGSDSWLHRKAGAGKTLAITAVAGTLHFSLPEEEQDIQALIDRFLGDLDLVLIEGWAQLAGPKIEILPADKQGRLREPRVRGSGELLAVVLSPGVKPELGELERLGLRMARGEGAHGGGGQGEGKQGKSGQGEDAGERGVGDAAVHSRRGEGTKGSESSAIPCFLWHEVAAVAESIMRWYGGDQAVQT